MSNWYKITFPHEDSNIGGQLMILKKEFEALFIAHGAPKQAALFRNQNPEVEMCTIYFSPEAATLAAELITKYGAVTCSAPKKGWVFIFVGDVNAKDSLLSPA